MAKDNNTSQMNKVDAINKELTDLLRNENIALTGNDSGRSEEILSIHNRYNSIVQNDYQGIRSSKDPGDSTYEYITNAILGKNINYSKVSNDLKNSKFTTGNKTQDDLFKTGQLEKIFTMGDSQVASYFLSSSSDLVHIYDEIDSVCNYFYQLEEANLITRDNVLRAEQINEDISMDITFPGITDDTSAYVAIVKKALNYQNVSVKIRDHVVPKAIKYGNYYMMIIPYKEIGYKLKMLNSSYNTGYSGGCAGYPFYESTDTHALFGDGENLINLDSCMESITNLFESFPDNVVVGEGNTVHLTESSQKIVDTIKNNLNNIFVCEDTSIPDIEGLGTHKKINKSITDGIMDAIKNAEKSIKDNEPSVVMKTKINVNADFDNSGTKDIVKDIKDVDIEFGGINKDDLKKYADKSKNTNTYATTIMNQDDDITDKDLKHSEQMIGCHIKLVDPRQLHPIKIFDYIIGYYYFENYDYSKMGTSISDIMGNQLNFNQRNTVIDGIVDSVLKNLKYGEILKGDNQLRSMILNCILYAEQRDNPIRIKFVRSDYIIPWKTNLDEHDNGQPVMLRSLLYARLYTSLMLFYSTAIITKSTDSEFYYLKESALDGQINNQISDLMDQLEDSNVDPIQIANGNILHGNRAINKRYYLNMGTSEIKPFEIDVVSGQNIDLHNEFMNDIKKMAIGATGVPAVMVDYVDEIEYATMLGINMTL